MHEVGLVATILLIPYTGLLVAVYARLAGQVVAHAAGYGIAAGLGMCGLGLVEAALLRAIGYPHTQAAAIAWSWPMALTCLLAIDWIGRRFRRLWFES